MENKKTTTQHKRSSNGRVQSTHTPTKKSNGFTKFVLGVSTAMSLALALTGYMLYASVERNNANTARIARMEEAQRLSATAPSTATPTSVTIPSVVSNVQNTSATTATLDQGIAAPTQTEEIRDLQNKARDCRDCFKDCVICPEPILDCQNGKCEPKVVTPSQVAKTNPAAPTNNVKNIATTDINKSQTQNPNKKDEVKQPNVTEDINKTAILKNDQIVFEDNIDMD